jgi:hypothetical protein
VRQATKKIVLKLNLVTFSNFLLFCYSAGFLCAQEKRIVFSFFWGFVWLMRFDVVVQDS